MAETTQTLKNRRHVVLWIFVIADWGEDLWPGGATFMVLPLNKFNRVVGYQE